MTRPTRPVRAPRREPETTGERMARAMEERGVSMAELCRRTGMSKSSLYRMRDGDRRGYLDSWAKVADAIGCKVSELTGE